MIITCIKGGLLPDFNKCIPYGEHDIAMYIDENIYFVFYDILDCKSQTRFSLSSFLDVDKEAHITKEEMDFRMDYFRRHKKALISKALRNPDETLCFNSIEAEVLAKYFHEMKFTCKVDIFVNNEQVELAELSNNKEVYELVSEFVEFFNMCEYVDAKEIADIRAGIFTPKKTKVKSLVGGLVAGGLGIIAGVAIGYKFGSKKNAQEVTIDNNEGQEA